MADWRASRVPAAPAGQFLQGEHPFPPFSPPHPGGVGLDRGGIASLAPPVAAVAFHIGKPVAGLLAKEALLAEAGRAPPGSIEEVALLAQMLAQVDLAGCGGGQGFADPRACGGPSQLGLGHGQGAGRNAQRPKQHPGCTDNCAENGPQQRQAGAMGCLGHRPQGKPNRNVGRA